MRDKRKTPPTPQHKESARFLSFEPEVRAAALQDETLRQLVNVFREHEESKAVRGTASSEYELDIRAAAAACDCAGGFGQSLRIQDEKRRVIVRTV